MFVPLGLPPAPDAARIPQLQAALERMRGETDQWSRINAGEDIANLAGRVADAAGAAAAIADRLIRNARALAADVPELLRRWSRAPQDLAGQIGRAEWVLDGWDRIVLLWQEARFPAGQRAALLEMAQLVVDLPEEVADWVDREPGLLQPVRSCRVISLNESWRTGSASFGLIARNERFRARCA